MSDDNALKAIMQLCQQTHDLVVRFGDKLDATDKKLDTHMREESLDIKAIAEVHRDAFPHGPAIHSSHHVEIANTKETRRSIWLAVQKKVAESSAWAVIVAIAVAAWYWVQGHVKP